MGCCLTAVCLQVIVLALILVLAGGGATGDWAGYVHRGLVLLVLACPCAIVIATPIPSICAIGETEARVVAVAIAVVTVPPCAAVLCSHGVPPRGAHPWVDCDGEPEWDFLRGRGQGLVDLASDAASPHRMSLPSRFPLRPERSPRDSSR